MAGAMRKMGIYLGLVEEDEDRRDDDLYDEYDDEPEQPAVRRYSARSEPVRAGARRFDSDEHTTRGALAVDPATRRIPVPAEEPDAAAYRITTLHPRTYNEARTIGEHFRDGTPVIINLTEMDEGDARRLVDFAAGLAFGLRGTIERVTNRVFLLSPANVQVTAEDKAKIAEGGFFNQS